MKTTALSILLLFFSASILQAQNPKISTAEFEVNGTCGMCKDRIEEALSRKGVKQATWNVDSKVCTVIYRNDKVTEAELHEWVAEIGHDTQHAVADSAAYENLHACCKYRDENAKCEEEKAPE